MGQGYEEFSGKLQMSAALYVLSLYEKAEAVEKEADYQNGAPAVTAKRLREQAEQERRVLARFTDWLADMNKD